MRRGARRIGRLALNLAITIAIGIGATLAVTWFLERDGNGNGPPSTPPPVVTPAPPPDDDREEDPTPQPPPPDTPPELGAVMLLDVVDVASDDTLNVRAGPGVGFAPPIAELAPDATGVAATGNVANIGRSYWAEVALADGGRGWASLNFLDTDEVGAELALTGALRASVAGVLLSEPGTWVVTGDVAGHGGPGREYPVVAELPAGSVVGGTGDAALVAGEVWAEVVPEGAPPSWLPSAVLDLAAAPDFLGQPPGLLCAEVAPQGFDYAAAYAYWEWDGRPDRMDVDTNGIPCETIYPPAEVEFYLAVRGEA